MSHWKNREEDNFNDLLSRPSEIELWLSRTLLQPNELFHVNPLLHARQATKNYKLISYANNFKASGCLSLSRPQNVTTTLAAPRRHQSHTDKSLHLNEIIPLITFEK